MAEDEARAGSDAGAGSDRPTESGAAESGAAGSGAAFVLDLDGLDLAGLLTSLGAAPGGELADQETVLAEETAAIEAAGGGTVRDVTGELAELLPAGPALAGWLAGAAPAGLSDWDLPGVAACYRKVASWAQAGELRAVATVASRAAARDEHIGTDDEGLASLSASAAGEVSLALSMSHYGATWWAGLGISLAWRLRATGAALAAGTIDLTRARIIAEATALLDDDTARAVEAVVLPKAGQQTTGQLRAALKRAILTIDPGGADDRRRRAEREAKVSLYPDHDGTAALAGSSLPGVHAAAAMARITALARALKSSGATGGIDLLRAHVFLGLLLGTMPPVPQGGDESPDQPPGPGGEAGSGGAGSGGPGGAGGRMGRGRVAVGREARGLVVRGRTALDPAMGGRTTPGQTAGATLANSTMACRAKARARRGGTGGPSTTKTRTTAAWRRNRRGPGPSCQGLDFRPRGHARHRWKK